MPESTLVIVNRKRDELFNNTLILQYFRNHPVEISHLAEIEQLAWQVFFQLMYERKLNLELEIENLLTRPQ